jgi:DNA-binding CsgD family transcriptional regulator/tetratricopeptide (TPR) repeat protein
VPPSASPRLGPLPVIGRAGELELINSLLNQAQHGNGGMLILCGESGVGKSRVLQIAATEATRRGWSSAVGRAYPVEVGIPYAPFADGLLPLIRGVSPEILTALTRGAEAELACIFPVLRLLEQPTGHVVENAAEFKTRLLWNFSQFLGRLAARQPLLIVLDDLQWADASSLELLHFVARQIGGERIVLLCAYNEALRDQNPQLRAMEQSLVAQEVARVRRVLPLTLPETGELIRDAFGAGEAVTREFTALLFGWTRGNPFFMEEILKALLQSGRLHQREGVWLGWHLEQVELPSSVREAVLNRLGNLSVAARALADLLAVLGTSIAHEALHTVSSLDEMDLVAAIDELRRDRILEERMEAGAVVYDFAHPVFREALYGEIGLARGKLLHARVARALEVHYGANAIQHAGELAYHYARTSTRDLAPKTVEYLALAGRAALEKYANREAADYLSAAIERASELGTAEPQVGLIEELARARQRLGEYPAAIELWERVRAAAERAGDAARSGAVERRLALAYFWSGRYPQAIEHFDRGLEPARRSGDRVLQARLLLGKGECFIEMGRPAEAHREIVAALEIAEHEAAPELLARVHLALLLLHTWTGPPERAHLHGQKVLALADELGDPRLSCTGHWAMAVLAGLTGDRAAAALHIAESERLAGELRSPLHRLRAAELAIELMSNTGEWELAIAVAERTIATARALNQRALLARLLVWTALIHLGRGDMARGKSHVDEAWELAGADATGDTLDVHAVVPVHAGRAAYHVAMGEYAEAVRVGEAGLAIADRTGYTVWAIHRLLPVIAEAYLWMADVEGASRTGARLRADSERLGHKLGLAWADACDALLVWLRGDIGAGVRRLRAAAERLEMIPVVPDAARLRRQFAARLRDHGEREEALRELRNVHEVFLRLGAECELAKTREQIRELGVRPPVKEVTTGLGGLSAREVEIARLVAEHRSNKTIAKLLDISPRTVSTHLSNIFSKLEIGSRGELADFFRQLELRVP